MGIYNLFVALILAFVLLKTIQFRIEINNMKVIVGMLLETIGEKKLLEGIKRTRKKLIDEK